MKTISIVNQKGGVGKTTTAYHLAAALVARGLRVLAVDLAPNGSLSIALLGEEAMLRLPASATILPVLAGERPDPRSIIRPTGWEGVDIAPGQPAGAVIRELLPPSPHGLRDFLGVIANSGEHGLTILDCPSSISMYSRAALSVSDAAIIPVQADDVLGLLAARSAAEMVERSDVRLLGLLVSCAYPRQSGHRRGEEGLRDEFRGRVLDTRIPACADVAEAHHRRVSVEAFRPRGAAAVAFRSLAGEVLTRLYAA